MGHYADVRIYYPGSTEPASLDEIERRLRDEEDAWNRAHPDEDDVFTKTLTIDQLLATIATIRAEHELARRYQKAYERLRHAVLASGSHIAVHLAQIEHEEEIPPVSSPTRIALRTTQTDPVDNYVDNPVDKQKP